MNRPYGTVKKKCYQHAPLFPSKKNPNYRFPHNTQYWVFSTEYSLFFTSQPSLPSLFLPRLEESRQFRPDRPLVLCLAWVKL